MPSFRCKIKKLRFQGILTDKETNRILYALDKAENTAEWEYKEISNTNIIGWWCSNCHIGQKIKSKYCPNCGAKMKENGRIR